jgi:hypothetical protein
MRKQSTMNVIEEVIPAVFVENLSRQILVRRQRKPGQDSIELIKGHDERRLFTGFDLVVKSAQGVSRLPRFESVAICALETVRQHNAEDALASTRFAVDITDRMTDPSLMRLDGIENGILFWTGSPRFDRNGALLEPRIIEGSKALIDGESGTDGIGLGGVRHLGLDLLCQGFKCRGRAENPTVVVDSIVSVGYADGCNVAPSDGITVALAAVGYVAGTTDAFLHAYTGIAVAEGVHGDSDAPCEEEEGIPGDTVEEEGTGSHGQAGIEAVRGGCRSRSVSVRHVGGSSIL